MLCFDWCDFKRCYYAIFVSSPFKNGLILEGKNLVFSKWTTRRATMFREAIKKISFFKSENNVEVYPHVFDHVPSLSYICEIP